MESPPRLASEKLYELFPLSPCCCKLSRECKLDEVSDVALSCEAQLSPPNVGLFLAWKRSLRALQGIRQREQVKQSRWTGEVGIPGVRGCE